MYGEKRGPRASPGDLKGEIIGSSIHRLVGLHLSTGRDAPIFEVPQEWMVASGGISGPLAVLAPKVQKVVLRPRFLEGPAKSVEFPFGVGFHFLPFVYVYGLFRGLRASAAVLK